MDASIAVRVRDAYKSYGDKVILDNLQMTVTRGTIYGLLGASGCGKTTLLSCVVGRKKLDTGEIWVLGDHPGKPGSGVPGPRVGYMPQEIALIGEFTVKDAVYYFGRLLEVEEELIFERFKMFSNLLELPPENRYVGNCSGGQKRRISFAAAMINMPELLILDEPTAGVDPVLRDSIWNYLVEVTAKTKMAVIITTHYIEETRQAHKIGLMRGGALLAEESPARLLSAFNCDNLEDVFLILSKRQEQGRLENLAQTDESDVISSNDYNANYTTPQPKKKYSSSIIQYNRVKALLSKNWKQFYRNVTGVVFLLALPVIQTVFFLMAVGNDIKDIPLAIVNHDSMLTSCAGVNLTDTAIAEPGGDCSMRNIGCRFVNFIDTPMIDKEYYSSLAQAFNKVKHGEAVGVMYMAENFTESIEDRLNQGRFAESEVLDFSEIKVWLDISNQQIGTTIKYKLYDIYFDFQENILKDCNYSKRLAGVPVHFEKDIFGSRDQEYINFMYPGAILTIVFFMATLMTSHIIITDRLEGIWDRSAVAGVTSIEIVMTHFMLQSCVVFVHMLEVMIIVYPVFDFDYLGSLWSIGLVLFIEGLGGMTFGFWISVMCGNYSLANIVTNGTFYIIILSCGMIWPIEAMPEWLQWISKALPYTSAIQSCRNIISKGWSITNWDVWNGLGITIIWMFLFTLVSIYHIRKNQ